MTKTLTPFTLDEMRALNTAFRAAHSAAQYMAARAFAPGDRVSFVGRRNEKITGIVRAVNIKTVSVDADNGGRWKCAASLLTLVNR